MLTIEKGAAATDPHRIEHRRILQPTGTPREVKTAWRLPCLHREFEDAVRGLKGSQKLLLKNFGINQSAISELPYGKVGFIRAEIQGGFFQHHNKMGYPLFIIATGYGSGWQIEDLVGFNPHAPRKFWLRTGNGYCIGDSDSRVIYPDITRFLRDGANGCVPLAGHHG